MNFITIILIIYSLSTNISARCDLPMNQALYKKYDLDNDNYLNYKESKKFIDENVLECIKDSSNFNDNVWRSTFYFMMDKKQTPSTQEVLSYMIGTSQVNRKYNFNDVKVGINLLNSI